MFEVHVTFIPEHNTEEFFHNARINHLKLKYEDGHIEQMTSTKCATYDEVLDLIKHPIWEKINTTRFKVECANPTKDGFKLLYIEHHIYCENVPNECKEKYNNWVINEKTGQIIFTTIDNLILASEIKKYLESNEIKILKSKMEYVILDTNY